MQTVGGGRGGATPVILVHVEWWLLLHSVVLWRMVLVTGQARAAYPVARPGTGARPRTYHQNKRGQDASQELCERGVHSRTQPSLGLSMRHGQARDDVDHR